MRIFVRHGPIVRRCSGNGPEALSLRVEEAKRRSKMGDLFFEGSFITHSTERRPALARRPPQGP